MTVNRDCRHQVPDVDLPTVAAELCGCGRLIVQGVDYLPTRPTPMPFTPDPVPPAEAELGPQVEDAIARLTACANKLPRELKTALLQLCFALVTCVHPDQARAAAAALDDPPIEGTA